MITKPGIYFDMPTTEYFADPCPQPSFTQSLAKLLLERSPLHAWYAHPRLNSKFKPDDDTKYDIGNIAHTLMIGRGKELVVLDQFEDWRKKEAQALREEAAGNGKLAVLGKHFMTAQVMVLAASNSLHDAGCADAFNKGNGEVVITWEEDGIWFRSMIDWRSTLPLCYDYKTTEMSVAPHSIGRIMANAGWDVQAAMQERGLEALALLERNTKFRFVAQENKPPYAVTVCELGEGAMTMGRKKLQAAIHIWRHCMKTNRFPGYPNEIIVPDYPGWAEAQWLDREQTEFSRPSDSNYDTTQEREMDLGDKFDRLIAG